MSTTATRAARCSPLRAPSAGSCSRPPSRSPTSATRSRSRPSRPSPRARPTSVSRSTRDRAWSADATPLFGGEALEADAPAQLPFLARVEPLQATTGVERLGRCRHGLHRDGDVAVFARELARGEHLHVLELVVGPDRDAAPVGGGEGVQHLPVFARNLAERVVEGDAADPLALAEVPFAAL